MYYGEDEIQLYLFDTGDYVEKMTVIKNYIAMDDATKARYVEKVVIDICKQTSPKKNYGISKQTLREYVKNVLDILEAEAKGAEIID